MAADASYAATPRLGIGQVSAANTNRDGTGTLVDILTGVAAGTRVDRVVVDATVTTTAGMVRLYIHDGTNTRLYAEIPIAAVTVSASVAGFRASIETPDLNLPSTSHVLKASTHNAEAMNVFAHGGDY
jgi:hypothetical protein